MGKYKLLGIGTNAKTIKGDGSEYLTAILYMAPHRNIEGINFCPMAEIAKCAKACLYSAGRGKFNSVIAARTRKAMLYRDDLTQFENFLISDLIKFSSYCIEKSITPVVRLNGTTDANYLKIIRMFPEIQFYDYTKVYNRATKRLPKNYHLTLSYSEANMAYADKVIFVAKRMNKNVAVVFKDKNNIPKKFLGMPVIDGDKDDLRFLDPSDKPHVIALYAKGDAKKDTTGFVVHN